MTLTSLSQSAATSPLHLVQEINHRVANEYAEAIATLSLAAKASTDRASRAALALAAQRLHAHAESHRALLPPTKSEVVNLADYISELCKSLSRAFLAERGVRLAVETDDIWLEAGRCWLIGLLIAELVRNAARHGLGGREGAIGLRIVKRRGRIICLVCDNGSPPTEMRSGHGAGLVRSLAADLGGSIAWRFTAGGCFVRLRIPSEAAAFRPTS